MFLPDFLIAWTVNLHAHQSSWGWNTSHVVCQSVCMKNESSIIFKLLYWRVVSPILLPGPDVSNFSFFFLSFLSGHRILVTWETGILPLKSLISCTLLPTKTSLLLVLLILRFDARFHHHPGDGILPQITPTGVSCWAISWTREWGGDILLHLFFPVLFFPSGIMFLILFHWFVLSNRPPHVTRRYSIRAAPLHSMCLMSYTHNYMFRHTAITLMPYDMHATSFYGRQLKSHVMTFLSVIWQHERHLKVKAVSLNACLLLFAAKQGPVGELLMRRAARIRNLTRLSTRSVIDFDSKSCPGGVTVNMHATVHSFSDKWFWNNVIALKQWSKLCDGEADSEQVHMF